MAIDMVIKRVTDGSTFDKRDDGTEKDGRPLAGRASIIGALTKKASDGKPLFRLLKPTQGFSAHGLRMEAIAEGEVWDEGDDARLERFKVEAAESRQRSRDRLASGSIAALPLNTQLQDKAAEAKAKAAGATSMPVGETQTDEAKAKADAKAAAKAKAEKAKADAKAAEDKK